MSELSQLLLAALTALPPEKQTVLQPLRHEEIRSLLAKQLLALHNGQAPADRPELGADETTPPLPQAFAPFAEAMQVWSAADGQPGDVLVEAFAAVLNAVPAPLLLVLLGQRTTPSSVVDGSVFPPVRSALLASATATLEADSLTCSARALAKHSERGDAFWAKPAGGPDVQNQHGAQLVERILNDQVWWNLFTHFQQGIIYEARIASGHGARWTHDGATFIGFVSPFERNEPSADRAVADAAGTSEPADDEPTEEDFEAKFGPLPEVLDREELQRRYSAGQRRFPGVKLSGANLSNLDLRGIDLTGSQLVRTKLYRTNLEGATLTECDLSGTFLSQTRLSHVSARRARFTDCRMDGVQWEKLDMEGSRFGNANMQRAELKECRMKKVGLGGANLTGAVIENVQLFGAYLEEACLSSATLTFCRFNRSRMANADLTSAIVDRCNFEAADLSNSHCQQATFQNCQFMETNLTSADLSQASFEHTKLDGAQLLRTNLEGCTAPKVSLIRANLSQANLKQAVLQHARLEQADLSRAVLTDTNLKGADLGGADLTGADVVGTLVDAETNFRAAKTINVDFGTNWSLRQQVMESSHELTIQQFRGAHPILGFLWWALLGCGKHPTRLLWWGIVIVFVFAGLMAIHPASFDFGQPNPTMVDHLRNSLAVFVTLDLAIDKGVDSYGRTVMLVQAILSYLMLGFMASLFSSIFPSQTSGS